MKPAVRTVQLSAGAGTNTVSNTLTNAGTGRVMIDTLGYDHASVDIVLGLADTTSNSPTLLTLGDSDTTHTSNATAITAFSGGTATSTSVAWVIPVTGVVTAITASMSGNTYRYEIDTRARRRYLMVSCSPATTQTMQVNARLSRGETIPVGGLGTGTSVTSVHAGVAAIVEG